MRKDLTSVISASYKKTAPGLTFPRVTKVTLFGKKLPLFLGMIRAYRRCLPVGIRLGEGTGESNLAIDGRLASASERLGPKRAHRQCRAKVDWRERQTGETVQRRHGENAGMRPNVI